MTARSEFFMLKPGNFPLRVQGKWQIPYWNGRAFNMPYTLYRISAAVQCL